MWSVLPGRRGSIKALYIWSCYLIFVAILWGSALISRESMPSGVLLRGLVLLIALLICGVLMDLWVLRPGDQHRRSALSFLAEYFRLNKVLPIATLVVPLVAAIVAIWSQVDSPPTTVLIPIQDSGDGAPGKSSVGGATDPGAESVRTTEP
jgi:hypothetical protein